LSLVFFSQPEFVEALSFPFLSLSSRSGSCCQPVLRNSFIFSFFSVFQRKATDMGKGTVFLTGLRVLAVLVAGAGLGLGAWGTYLTDISQT
jgi:hypothetical protein